MPIPPTCVLIRSTLGSSEPRFRNASNLMSQLGLAVTHINWARSNSDLEVLAHNRDKLYVVQARYGAGVGNYVKHLRFLIYIVKTLFTSKPKVIYACDLDTFLPSVIYRIFNRGILIFDQFDPLSARVRNRFLKSALDRCENFLVRSADIRITANLQRIPVAAQKSWFEIKNLFPIKLNPNIHKLNQDGFHLLYGGILGYDRGLIETVSVIRNMSDWTMDIFGQGVIQPSLMNTNSKNVVVHTSISHEELMERARTANLYLAMYDPDINNNRLTASNKLFEAAQLGIPLLTSKGTHIGEIVEKYKLGWVVTYGNLREIEAALNACAGLSKSEALEITANLLQYFQTELGHQNANTQLIGNRITAMMKMGVE